MIPELTPEERLNIARLSVQELRIIRALFMTDLAESIPSAGPMLAGIEGITAELDKRAGRVANPDEDALEAQAIREFQRLLDGGDHSAKSASEIAGNQYGVAPRTVQRRHKKFKFGE